MTFFSLNLCRLLAFVLTLACVNAPSAVADPVTLRVGGTGGFHLPDKNSTAPRDRADRAIVEAFEHQNPDIVLESAQGLRFQGAAAESSLLLQFAGGTAPDVVYVNFRQSASYIRQKFLMPLDGYLDADPSVMKRINPNIASVLRDAGHGKIYSIPYAQYVQALYYRKDLFQAAGLDPERPPANWDEFYTYCQKLTDQDKGKWGFEFGSDADSAGYWWINFLWQAGGDILKKNDKGQWVAAFDSPEGVKALLFYRKLMVDPWVAPDGKTYHGVAHHSSTMALDRAKGDVAMWFQYQSNIIANTADATTLNPKLIGIAPMPKGPTGITANEINAAMWGISSQIKDARTRDAAWRFVKFMSSNEADRIRTAAYVEAGLGDTVNPESLVKYGYGDFTTRSSRAWLEANKTLFKSGKPEPYAENMSQIYVLLGEPLTSIELNPTADPAALLAKSAREVNEKLTNYVDPVVMAQRRTSAWIGFGVILVTVLGVAGYMIRRSLAARLAASKLPAGVGRRVPARLQAVAWLVMAPALLSILIWAYYPLARGLQIAFLDYRLIGASKYVGLDNFIDAFHTPTFWNGLRLSVEYTALTLGIGFFLPIFLALGLSEIPRGKIIFRTMYYLPAITAPLVISFLWKIFEDSSPHGLLNSLLASASHGHIAPVKWLEDPSTAMLAVVLPAVWASAGPGCIIYLAALKSVPDDLYEAADLDGAGIWTKIVRITLPTLRPLILINLVGAVIGAFQATQNILAMTGGGPLHATQVLGLEIFYNAFLYLKFGYATAAAWVMGILLVGFTLWQLRILRNVQFSAQSA
jgi:multiple sugar transport system permease protein